jgi:hypothetical protein
MQFTVSAQHISCERIADVLCSALDPLVGWSLNNWCRGTMRVTPSVWEFESEPKCEDGHYDQDFPLNPGGAIYVKDTENDEREVLCLDAEAVQRGLNVLAEVYSDHLADMLLEHDDAITGDVFLQSCLFGKVMYA